MYGIPSWYMSAGPENPEYPPEFENLEDLLASVPQWHGRALCRGYRYVYDEQLSKWSKWPPVSTDGA